MKQTRVWILTIGAVFLLAGAAAIAGTQDEAKIKQCRQACADANNASEASCEESYQTCRTTCLESKDKRRKKKACTKQCQKAFGTCLDEVHAKTDKCLTGCGDIE